MSDWKKAWVVEDSGNITNAGNWVVKTYDENEGEIFGARFFGSHGHERAVEYAKWKNDGNGWQPPNIQLPLSALGNGSPPAS